VYRIYSGRYSAYGNTVGGTYINIVDGTGCSENTVDGSMDTEDTEEGPVGKEKKNTANGAVCTESTVGGRMVTENTVECTNAYGQYSTVYSAYRT
jgi:hypothetical protein